MTMVLRPAAVVLLLSALGSRLHAQNGDGQVVFERTGYRLTSIGGSVPASARVLDGSRRPVANAPITWRIEDPAVATVDRRGVVQSKRVGRTRLWAISGRDSASALILVDQWAARFAFQPAVLSFGAVREARLVQMQARDASGNAIPGVRLATACRILNPRVATMQGNGQIVAAASGVTYLRCTDRGVADSLRIEVRQRPRTAEIVDKALYTAPRIVTDSFQVRMRAVDSANNVISDARPTWASLEPRVLTVDPLTGWARGIAPGSAKIVAQLGDITDTVSVNVINAPGMNIAAITPAGEAVDTATTTATAAGRAQLAIYSLPTAVGDTTSLTIIPRDERNALADVSAVNLRVSGDSGIARITSDRRLVGLREGQIWIVGTFSGITDSSAVTIRARGSLSRETEANVAFTRPAYDTAAARRRNADQLKSTLDSILSGSSIQTTRGRYVSGQAIISQVAHGARLSETYLERRTGLIFGGRLVLSPWRRLNLAGSYRTGTLAPEGNVAIEDMTLSEADAQITVAPASWISFQGGGTLRAQSTEIAVQRWQFATVTVAFHPRLIGDRFRTVVGATLIPYGQLLESEGKPARAMESSSRAGDVGVEWQTRWVNAALLYHVERISFPKEGNDQRIDRFSMLRLRLGLQLGQ